jgi:hypothetical protein
MVELQIWEEWLQCRMMIRGQSGTPGIYGIGQCADRTSCEESFAGDNASRAIATAHYLCSVPFARLCRSMSNMRNSSIPHPADYPLYTYAAFGMPSDSFDLVEVHGFSWPLPAYIGSEDKELTSVGSLLMAFIASPARVARWKGAGDIVLFAAALLASRIEDRAAPNWRGRAAAKWLAGSLPTHLRRTSRRSGSLKACSRKPRRAGDARRPFDHCESARSG